MHLTTIAFSLQKSMQDTKEDYKHYRKTTGRYRALFNYVCEEMRNTHYFGPGWPWQLMEGNWKGHRNKRKGNTTELTGNEIELRGNALHMKRTGKTRNGMENMARTWKGNEMKIERQGKGIKVTGKETDRKEK